MTIDMFDVQTRSGGAEAGVFPRICSWMKKQGRGFCTVENLHRRLPITSWLPSYNLNYLMKDAIAGVSVGLTAIPQGIAYAVVAGLEPQYGLYAGFMGCFVYLVFGGCKDITIGPTAIMSLMIAQHVKELGVDFAILSAFLSGCVIFLMGVLQLGFLVEFISMPVTVGFTTAAAITIASSQLKHLLGLPGKSNGFLESWENFFENVGETRLWDSVLGVLTIVILLLLRKLKDVRGRYSWVCNGFSLSRNASAVIGGSVLAWALSTYDITPFILTGKVGSGLPPFRPPPFSTTTANNETLGFVDMVQKLGSSVIAIPLISLLESVAIAKAFAKGKTIDATQEMVALGLCNILGSFVLSMPTTGSFTRTAVNNASGVMTTFGGVFTGSLILLALGFLTSSFYFIPKATLAAVIIGAMFFMVEVENVILIWRSKRVDILPFLVTMLACLFIGLEYGIITGIGFNLLFILYATARPNITSTIVKVNGRTVVLITPDQSLVFSSAEYLRSKVLQTEITSDSTLIVLDGKHVHSIDATVAGNIKVLTEGIKLRQQEIIFWNWESRAANVLIHLDPSLESLFYSYDSLEHLVTALDRVQIAP